MKTNKQLESEHKVLKTRFVFDKAKRDVKGNYSIYNLYKRELEDIGLSPKEFERAVVELTKILRV